MTERDKSQQDESPQNNDADTPVVQVTDGDVEIEVEFPKVLPVLPTRDTVLFPDMILPLMISSDRDTKLVDQVLLKNRMLTLAPVINPEAEMPSPEDLHGNGCAGIILKMLKFPDGSIRILVQGVKRVRLGRYLQKDPYYTATIDPLSDIVQDSVQMDALHRSLREEFGRLVEMVPQFPDEIRIASLNITHPGRFADLVASNINLSVEERCDILDAQDVRLRLEKLSIFLGREMQIVELGSKIQEDVKSKIAKGQREYFLREQLRAIRSELGDDQSHVELEELAAALEKAGLPEEARKEADRELKRLERMQPGSAEYTVAHTYLDWMITLPWVLETEDLIEIPAARKILDADHYGLEKIKERIIEYLAVRKIYPEGRSPILCFVGPPGVGKTSLGHSIARAMGRKFVRISLGGVRDEAEIRGHRRTYIGALPGRIIQGLRKGGTRNPVFMMDEIDKLGSDFRGDPSAALLEVLDPEQNSAFSDHYLDVPFDLSRVVFIMTANQLETIPPALRDRMEILQLPGYGEEEKVQIVRRHLIPKVLSEHGLTGKNVRFHTSAIKRIIGEYTREAGLRNLERMLSSVVRKIAVKIASGKKGPFAVKAQDVPTYLGPQTFFAETVDRSQTPGVAVGLVWTAAGGDIIFVESSRMPGKKNLLLTGKLGDVIKESAQAALSWVRTHSGELKIKEDFFENADLHIHFPEGAVPKDGPSAGITLVASLVSLLTGRSIKARLAMTGEMTLRGKVLPVGGIKEKMLAARRAGIKDVILPADNMNDVNELPVDVRNALRFHPVREIDEMIAIAFPRGKKKA